MPSEFSYINQYKVSLLLYYLSLSYNNISINYKKIERAP